MFHRNKAPALAAAILLSLCAPAFAQDADATESTDEGFKIGVDYTGDVMSVVDGGIDTGTTYTGLGNVNFDFTSGSWSWHANAYVPHGDSPTEEHVGDFAVVSNIDMGDLDPRLQEFWFERRFGDSSLRAGMIAADTEFWGTDNGALYVSSAFGAPSIVSANLPNPSIFPTATFGVRFDTKVGEDGIFRVAVLDGDAGDPTVDNRHGTDVELDGDVGALVLAEYHVDHTGDDGVPSGYRIGGYYHSGDFIDFSDLSVRSGQWGLLGVLDLPVSDNIGWFGRIGYSSRHRSVVPWSFETGMNVYNAFGTKGTFGVALAWIDLNDVFDVLVPDIANEKIVEVTFDYPINDYFAIQPDLQYIINTGGVKSGGESLVIGVRGKLSFSN